MSSHGQQQQRPIIHPKLRGKLENWQRSQAAMATTSGQKQTGASNGSSVGESGDSKSKAGSLSKSSFFHEDYETVARRSSFGESTKPKPVPTQQPEIIHSGHFMVSEIAYESGGDSDDDGQEDVKMSDEFCSKLEGEGQLKDDSTDLRNKHQSGGSNRSSSNCSTSHRKAVNIDGSLTKLFKHMSLAYSGKITSPKWKQFSGLKLMLKDKIRLNNVIWRAWHIEYVRAQRPMVRMFATPLEEDHKKPQSVLLEGKYWKRRLGAIVEEYKKWRKYFRPVRDAPLSEEDVLHVVNGATSETWNGLDYEMASLLARVGKDTKGTPARRSAIAGTVAPVDSACIGDDFFQMMDFSDTLFQSLNQPFAFPDPREIAQAANNADVIQPGLIQLQPTLDDFIPDFTDLLTTENFLPPTPCNPAQDSPCQTQRPPQPQTQQALDPQRMEPQPQIQQQLAQMQQPPHDFLSDEQLFVTQLPIAGASGATGSDMSQLDSATPTPMFAGDWLTTVPIEPPQQPPEVTPPPQAPQYHTVPPLVPLKQSGCLGPLTFVSLSDSNCNTLAVIEPAIDKAGIAHVTSSSADSKSVIDAGSTPVSFLVHPAPLLDVAPTPDTNFVAAATAVAPNDSTVDSKEESLRQLREFQDTFSALSPASLSFGAGGSSQLLMNLLKSESSPGAAGGRSSRSGSGGSSTGCASIPSPTHGGGGHKARHKSADAPTIRSSSYSSPLKSNVATTCSSSPLFSMPVAPNGRGATTSTRSTHTKPSVLPNEVSSHHQRQQHPQLHHHQQHAYHPPPPSDGNRSSGIPKQNRLILPSPVVLPQSRAAAPSPLGVAQASSAFHQQQSSPPDSAGLGSSSITHSAPTTYQQSQHSIIFSPAILPPQQQSTHYLSPVQSHRACSAGGGGLSRSAASTPSPGGPPSTPDSMAAPLNNRGPSSSTASPTSPPVSSPSSDMTRPKRDDVILNDEEEDASVWVGPSFKKSKIDQGSFDEEEVRTERRQKVHVSSEQKRRGNINSGFEMLQAMVPSVNSNLKVSKAQTLAKATEYMTKLKQDRERRKLELANLRAEADGYGRAITEYQNALPATGVSFSYVSPNNGKAEQSKLLWKMYRDYVRSKTMDNWKFWVLSKLLTPLFDTYVAAVTGLKMERTEELVEALQRWMEMHCSLTALRPMIMNALRKLSTSTSIINRPDRLPQQAVEDVSSE